MKKINWKFLLYSKEGNLSLMYCFLFLILFWSLVKSVIEPNFSNISYFVIYIFTLASAKYLDLASFHSKLKENMDLTQWNEHLNSCSKPIRVALQKLYLFYIFLIPISIRTIEMIFQYEKPTDLLSPLLLVGLIGIFILSFKSYSDQLKS